jgi:hypothetical protein
MPKVIEEKIHLSKKAKNLFSKIDFADTFSTTNHYDNINKISHLVFNTSPKWITTLFKIRNKMVSFIGLKTEKPSDYNTKFKVGGYINFFKIYDIADNEIILGADDSHLNFRAIINITKAKTYNIKVTTLVKYNNTKGKIYMSFIKPFHRLVVMKMVKQAYSVKKLELN